MRRSRRISATLTYLVVVAASLFSVGPVLWMLSTSFKPAEVTFAVPPVWLPSPATLQNYRNIWTHYPLARYFANSLIVVGCSTVIAVVVAALTGYGVTRFRLRGRGTLATFLLMGQMFPSVMLVIPYFRILREYHLIDTYAGLILVFVSFTVPFSSWMMIGYFRSIPRELDYAAAIDGCTPWQAFRLVILPLTLPGLAATAIYSFLQGWNEFIFPLVLTTTERTRTLAVGIGLMVGEYRTAWNDLMAASVVGSLPLIAGFLLLQRYFISSLTAGAVKE